MPGKRIFCKIYYASSTEVKIQARRQKFGIKQPNKQSQDHPRTENQAQNSFKPLHKPG